MGEIDAFVEGKKVLLLGFGREGRSTYRVLKASAACRELAVADLEEGQVKAFREKDPETAWIWGADYQKDLDRYDLVFKSPGVVLEKPADRYQCRILSQTEVFFRLFGQQIVGITGTKGKSTTTSLIYHVLKSAGRKALLAGNIGIPAFDHMDEVDKDTEIIFELSCHQLEHMSVSPHVALLLNIHEEHLDHYGTMEAYVAAKQQIYRNQKEGDLLICGSGCLPASGVCPSKLIKAVDLGENGEYKEGMDRHTLWVAGSCIYWDGFSFPIPKGEIQLMGHHNYVDIGFAYVVCKLKGISDQAFAQGLKTYEPLPHRLHFLGEKDGIRYYDDSISTICDTTIHALNTLKDADTVLIGGMDRGIHYGELIEYLSGSTVSHIILMEATGKRIYQEIQKDYPEFQRLNRLVLAEHLEEGVMKAKALTEKGKSCVLSPAAASYGIFKDFEERGDAFRRLVFGEAVFAG